MSEYIHDGRSPLPNRYTSDAAFQTMRVAAEEHELGSGKGAGMDAKAAEAKVKARWPASYSREGRNEQLIWSHGGVGRDVIGRGPVENSAWIDAASRMDAQEQAPCDGTYGMMSDNPCKLSKDHKGMHGIPAQEQADARDGGADAEPAAERARFAELNRALWPNNAGLSSLPEETIQALQNLQRDLSARQAECERYKQALENLMMHVEWTKRNGPYLDAGRAALAQEAQ